VNQHCLQSGARRLTPLRARVTIQLDVLSKAI
jgi:hypothetical protein